MTKSIVKSSISIKNELKKRFKELDLTLTAICNDAKEKGMNLSIHSLSKYLNDYEKNNLSEENIVWLAYRYQIYVTLLIGVPRIDNGKFKMEIVPYNEKEALKNLYLIFPQSKPVDKTKKDGKPKTKRNRPKKHGVGVE